jgi:hypothetical protein
MAQAYNHMIMPLANSRDKLTQLTWGIRDFDQRFNRKPKGMWLPETAVDIETLDMMAMLGIRLTILAPSQAARTRRINGTHWKTVHNDLDTTRPYRVMLESGRHIDIFFYNGQAAAGVAFEGLLNRGDFLAGRLLGAFPTNCRHNPIVHIATDGESYGHHHRFGGMALAYALNMIETGGKAELINYGCYLEWHPPEEQVEIHENTVWSCAHGLGRWECNCGPVRESSLEPVMADTPAAIARLAARPGGPPV